MKKVLATLALSALPLMAGAARDGVRFDAVVTAGGAVVASPSTWVPFGETAVIEVPERVRILATAAHPAGERSLVAAQFFRFQNGGWVPDEGMTMNASIGSTPSFELDLKDEIHRVVLMPRAAPLPGDA